MSGIGIEHLPKDLAVNEILELNVRRFTLPLIFLSGGHRVMRIRKHPPVLRGRIVSKQELRGQVHLTFLKRIGRLLLEVHHKLLFFVLALLIIFRDLIYV